MNADRAHKVYQGECEANDQLTRNAEPTPTSAPTASSPASHHSVTSNKVAMEIDPVRIPCVTTANEDAACQKCGGTPCYWLQVAESVVDRTKTDYPRLGIPDKKNSAARKTAYKAYVYERYGFLGAGNRVQLPQCALEGIRTLWPDEMGAYMGYKEH